MNTHEKIISWVFLFYRSPIEIALKPIDSVFLTLWIQ